ncbi:MAG TPA: heparan-alpha-glucosaminide N-acetyltransferase domain-containing protein [Chitinophagaceae bacterium]|nr:heparan-alpha-glucosaminide N-acetyltransferase domain-containing protein [Chitinophagaceae bacterium]
MTKMIARGPRYPAIDVLRGLVMIIMALDHVRDYFHIEAMTGDPLNLATTTPALFFTRWITHFCAPVFVFLSGLSAAISGQRKTNAALSVFLIKRGLWLIAVELLVISLAITFNPFYNLFILQVIWAIGWSMVILGLLIRVPVRWVIIIAGAILFFGHNITDYLSLPQTGTSAVLWKLLITSPGDFFSLGAGRFVLLAYAVLPWTGIMIAGYVLGRLYQPSVQQQVRVKWLFRLGVLSLLLFLLLRFINHYGDPAPWSVQQDTVFTILSFINITKYPASLQYACMTIGAALLLLAVWENASGRLLSFFSVYGRVPFFYYVLHFFLVHALCVVAFFLSGYGLKDAADTNSPFLFRPVNFGFSLPWVYGIWLLVIVLLYYPCRWYGRYKQARRHWWLSYL